jgi:hypothetical protein
MTDELEKTAQARRAHAGQELQAEQAAARQAREQVQQEMDDKIAAATAAPRRPRAAAVGCG